MCPRHCPPLPASPPPCLTVTNKAEPVQAVPCTPKHCLHPTHSASAPDLLPTIPRASPCLACNTQDPLYVHASCKTRHPLLAPTSRKSRRPMAVCVRNPQDPPSLTVCNSPGPSPAHASCCPPHVPARIPLCFPLIASRAGANPVFWDSQSPTFEMERWEEEDLLALGFLHLFLSPTLHQSHAFNLTGCRDVGKFGPALPVTRACSLLKHCTIPYRSQRASSTLAIRRPHQR
ncbi:hypothetical protein GGX14DRAFT_561847 [Mycena pura]|uniref:Uncharacterized protein n=1 Tax=Mycena pura TaxID=153505 RepID=A0AAD6YFQ9_9AGAR|nr:hypothetical protein GGX14DRAFT_561847 [Mycena pura]